MIKLVDQIFLAGFKGKMNLQLLFRFSLFPCIPLKPSQNTQTFCANNIRFDIKYAKQLMISKPGYSWFYKEFAK